MSVNIAWVDDEKTILQYTIVGSWTWDEFYPAYEQAIKEETQQSHTVHVIVDVRKGTGMPPNVLTHIKSISDKQPDNLGISVIISNNRFVKSIFDIGVKIHTNIAHQFQIAHTIEDAIAIIEMEKQRECNNTTNDS